MKEYAKLLKCTYEQIPFEDVSEQQLVDMYRWFQIAPQEQFVGDPSTLANTLLNQKDLISLLQRLFVRCILQCRSIFG
jgi:hypothetical protein